MRECVFQLYADAEWTKKTTAAPKLMDRSLRECFILG